jgi:hypothetical protein
MSTDFFSVSIRVIIPAYRAAVHAPQERTLIRVGITTHNAAYDRNTVKHIGS